jgi:hypothetical protein
VAGDIPEQARKIGGFTLLFFSGGSRHDFKQQRAYEIAWMDADCLGSVTK